MAKLPNQLSEITERFGPHPAYSAGVRLATNVDPDKVVTRFLKPGAILFVRTPWQLWLPRAL